MEIIFNLFGNCDTLLKTFLLFIIIDYITGILKAIYNKKLNSSIGAKGIVKKIGYILLVMVSYALDNLNNDGLVIRDIVLYMFIINEGISILENLSKVGIVVPKAIKDILHK